MKLLIAFLLLTVSVQGQTSRGDSLRKVAESNAADSARADAYIGLSLEMRKAGRNDEAFESAEKGRQIAIKSGLSSRIAKTTYYMGVACVIQGRYDEGMAYYNAARDTFKRLGDEKNYAAVTTALGGLYTMIGDQQSAIDYQLEALRIKQNLNDSVGIAASMTNIGNVYHSMNQLDTALNYFLAAKELHEKFNDAYKLTDDYYNVGNVYHSLGNDSLGLYYLRRSLQVADSLGNSDIGSYSFGVIASIYRDKGMTDSAKYYYQKAMAVSEAAGDQRMLSVHNLQLGTLYADKGDFVSAERFMRTALGLASELGDIEQQREIHNGFGKMFRASGRFDSALVHYEKYIFFRDSLESESNQMEILRKRMKFDYETQTALDKAEQEKKDAITEAELQRRNILIVLAAVVLVFVLALAWIIYRRSQVTRQQNILIQQQKEEVERQRDQVELQKAVIEDKNRNITDSINYARRIQQAILPQAAEVERLLPASFIFFLPKDIVSGDFYWISETKNHVFYATCDCTGHGVPGGFMSVLGASLLNEIVNERGVLDPAEVLNLVRDKIVAALHQTGESGENKDGMDMSICRLDRNRTELCFAAANNGLWIVRKGELMEFKADKQPVGIGVTVAKPFTAQTVALQKGDMIYTYTDGFADQFGGPRGKKYKYSQLKSFLVSCADAEPQTQLKNLAIEFESWKGNAEQVDDVLMIGIKI